MKSACVFARISFTALGIAFVLATIAFLQIPGKIIMRSKDSETRRLRITRANVHLLGYMSKVGMEETGHWASSLDDLGIQLRAATVDRITMADGWKRPLIYTPYDKELGYGTITSLGQDGKPGGGGFDADIVFRFDESTVMEE